MMYLKHILAFLREHFNADRGGEFLDANSRLNRASEVSVSPDRVAADVEGYLRGLFQGRALALNGDWIWPWWIEQQRDPRSEAFVPVHASATSGNITNRNWTAVGTLGGRREAIVDPRGLVTPWPGQWSLDTFLEINGETLFPSRLHSHQVSQRATTNPPGVQTEFAFHGLDLQIQAWAFRHEANDYLVQTTRITNSSDAPLSPALIHSLRPANPEGVCLVHNLAYNTRGFWNVEAQVACYFPLRPDYSIASNHERGDAAFYLDDETEDNAIHCPVGLATGASVWRLHLEPGATETVFAVLPLEPMNPRFFEFSPFTPDALQRSRDKATEEWQEKRDAGTTIQLPDPRLVESFEASKTAVLLLNDGHEITTGPTSGHTQSFANGEAMLQALAILNYPKEVRHNLEFYPLKQWKNGYFCARKGEWASTGQAICAIADYCRLHGDTPLLEQLLPAIKRGVVWIEKKRNEVSFSRRKPKGLLPAGFSPDHSHPNDFNYYDNFWSLRAVQAAAGAADALGLGPDARLFQSIYDAYLRDLNEAINRDVEFSPHHLLPAAPRRRPDAGMAWNVTDASLELFPPEESPWMRRILDSLGESALNGEVRPDTVMVLCRALLSIRNPLGLKLLPQLQRLASPTWCWPEVIHPRTRGGSRGEGHHGPANAQWVLLLRNLILRENQDVLEVTPFLPPEWQKADQHVGISNAPTNFGMVTVRADFHDNSAALTLEARWRVPPREIHWHLPSKVLAALETDHSVRLNDRMVIFPANISRVSVELEQQQA
ncbi:MAG: hypothetical protein K1X53_10055 [Candidatus Sumerlaeaceae bacterium]|nr:hypothetical protein [Candidatus Sumerlaeaceae bacterium]